MKNCVSISNYCNKMENFIPYIEMRHTKTQYHVNDDARSNSRYAVLKQIICNSVVDNIVVGIIWI